MGIGSIVNALRQRPDGSAEVHAGYAHMGRRFAWITLAMAALVFAVMERALITRDYSVSYVTQVGSSRTRPFFNFTALWSALEGSIILWTLILCGYVAVVARKFRRRSS